jgi:hypothetical protein
LVLKNTKYVIDKCFLTDIYYLAIIMRNRTLNIALLSLIVTFASCNKITESVQQDIIVNDTVYFDIPALTSTTTLTTISGISSNLNLESEIKNSVNDFTLSSVKATKITSLNLALGLIGNDSIDVSNNFGNLETLRFRISANDRFANLSNTTITSSAKSGSMALTPTIAPDSLISFLINPSKTYNVIVKAKTITTTTMKVRAAATYTITVSK